MQTAGRWITLPSRRSSSSLRTVASEISKTILGSNIRWHGKSFAASVPSRSFQLQKGQKKISKQERHAMVESFVDKYRASNAGRFPTASHVRKETGGSYYVIRQIVQELEYNHKVSPSSKMKEIQLEKAEKVISPNSGGNEEPSISEVVVSVSPTADDMKSSTDLVDSIKVNGYEHLDAKEEPQILEVMGEERLQNDDQDYSGGEDSKASGDNPHKAQAYISISTKSEVTVEAPSSTGAIEGDQKSIRATESLQDASVPRVDLTENRKTKQEELNSDQGESTRKATGLWGNLKSLADGIIGFWKKM